MNDDTEGTVIRRALILKPEAAERQAALRRAADALDLLAGVFAGYPKTLKDLEIACEQLRRHALELRMLSEDAPPS